MLAGHRSRLLLADSSHAHLTSLLDTAPDLPSCSPDTPDHCPAAARGQLCAFPDSSTLDACPRLPAARSPVAASCAPISVAGRSVGVLQLTAPTAARPARSEDTAATQQLIARRLGDRLSILRAFARSERQATTDPLTGLLNRRSLEDRVRATAADPAGYAVAYLDIDRFKQLNDTHGHAAGDRALRAFATTLRRRLRPLDLIGRWGGEEFLAVLPDCDRDQARTVMERLRADLLDTLAAGDTPGFTVSCGIATSADAPTFADVVHRADQALLAANVSDRGTVSARNVAPGVGPVAEPPHHPPASSAAVPARPLLRLMPCAHTAHTAGIHVVLAPVSAQCSRPSYGVPSPDSLSGSHREEYVPDEVPC